MENYALVKFQSVSWLTAAAPIHKTGSRTTGDSTCVRRTATTLLKAKVRIIEPSSANIIYYGHTLIIIKMLGRAHVTYVAYNRRLWATVHEIAQ